MDDIDLNEEISDDEFDDDQETVVVVKMRNLMKKNQKIGEAASKAQQAIYNVPSKVLSADHRR